MARISSPTPADLRSERRTVIMRFHQFEGIQNATAKTGFRISNDRQGNPHKRGSLGSNTGYLHWILICTTKSVVDPIHYRRNRVLPNFNGDPGYMLDAGWHLPPLPA